MHLKGSLMISRLCRITLFGMVTLIGIGTVNSAIARTPGAVVSNDVPTIISNKVDLMVEVLHLKGLRDSSAIIACGSGVATLIGCIFSNQEGMPKVLVLSLVTWVLSSLAALKMTKALHVAEEIKHITRERIVPLYGSL